MSTAYDSKCDTTKPFQSYMAEHVSKENMAKKSVNQWMHEVVKVLISSMN